jgi:hypothetical protein
MNVMMLTGAGERSIYEEYTARKKAENRLLSTLPLTCEVIEQLSRALFVQRRYRKEKINFKEKL